MDELLDLTPMYDRPGVLLLHGELDDDGNLAVEGIKWVSPLAAADRIDALHKRGHTVVKLRLAEIMEPEAEPASYDDDDDGEDPDFDDDEGELDFEADHT